MSIIQMRRKYQSAWGLYIANWLCTPSRQQFDVLIVAGVSSCLCRLQVCQCMFNSSYSCNCKAGFGLSYVMTHLTYYPWMSWQEILSNLQECIKTENHSRLLLISSIVWNKSWCNDVLWQVFHHEYVMEILKIISSYFMDIRRLFLAQN